MALKNEYTILVISLFNDSINSEITRNTRKIEMKNRKFIVPENIRKLFRIKYGWQNDLRKLFYRNINRTSDEYRLLSCQIQLLKTIIKEQVELHQATEVDRSVANTKSGPRAFKKVFEFVGCEGLKALRNFRLVIIYTIKALIRLNILGDIFQASMDILPRIDRILEKFQPPFTPI